MARKAEQEKPVVAPEDEVVEIRFKRASEGRKVQRSPVKGRFKRSDYIRALKAAAAQRVFTREEGDWVTIGVRRSDIEAGQRTRIVPGGGAPPARKRKSAGNQGNAAK